MTKEFAQRIEELKLLGWSEEGARKYAEHLLDSSINKPALSNFQILIGAACISFSLILIIAFIFNRLRSKKKLVEVENLIKEDKTVPIENIAIIMSETKIVKETINEKVLSKKYDDKDNKLELIFIDRILNKLVENKNHYINKFVIAFKEKPAEVDDLIQHFLLILILFVESLTTLCLGLISFATLANKKLKSRVKKIPSQLTLQHSDEQKELIFQERKKFLSTKKNIELKNLLKGEVNISRLKKSDLIERVLLLEFGSNNKKNY